jgi:hypothetical protein
MNRPAHHRVSRCWLAMANTGRRSSIGSRFPSVPVPLSRGGVPSRPQQFTIPELISQGSQESFQGDGEIGVDFQWHRVRPLTRIGGWASQEVDDESEEDVHGDLWYVFSTLESFVITCKLKSLMMEICFD